MCDNILFVEKQPGFDRLLLFITITIKLPKMI